jgi:hypothetical protein
MINAFIIWLFSGKTRCADKLSRVLSKTAHETALKMPDDIREGDSLLTGEQIDKQGRTQTYE